MIDIGAESGELKLYGLVRDKDGKPKIDDKKDIHPIIWEMLTDIEKQEIKDELYS
jgi:hypothetical protein